MRPFKARMLTGTVIPVAMALGVGVTGVVLTGVPSGIGQAMAQCSPCAARNPCNPCAAKNPCNPSAAKNPCNPCAAKNPCNPCAAVACNPCNPCAGGAVAASQCLIPRLVAAAPCNPCAAKNPWNPCAAKAAGNPCAAKSPCAPQVVKAACNPCNPCTARNPCNPCAARNPCNPCAAGNPCNPCAAKNPCNPCAAGAAIKLTDAEAAQAYDCVVGELRTAYAKSGNAVAASYQGWRRYSRVAYESSTHGGRYVQNYANPEGRAYGLFEKAGVMPVGATLAKDSFGVNAKGQVTPGPLFLMEKMAGGFNAASGDWKYTMIMPNGSVFGETRGKNAAGMQFCVECHAAVGEDQDHMMLLPAEYRAGQ